MKRLIQTVSVLASRVPTQEMKLVSAHPNFDAARMALDVNITNYLKEPRDGRKIVPVTFEIIEVGFFSAMEMKD